MNQWDWKYRVFFDNSIRNQAVEWMSHLSKAEQDVYHETLNFYSSFYSFGILFDLICESPKQSSDLIDKAIENIAKVIHTPNAIVPFYKRKIKELEISKEEKNKLIKIFEISCSAKDINKEYWMYISNLFGTGFNTIKECFSNNSFDKTIWRIPRQKIIKSQTSHMFGTMFSDLLKDEKLIKTYGSSSIKDFSKTIVEGNGYGEWWDRDISESDKDELVLYTNENQVKRDDYWYTIIHETYPGHGHFYNYVRNNNTQMDHGAMILIEGWATYCEWNTYPSKYVDAIKHNALLFLYESFNCNSDEHAKIIYDRKRKQGKTITQFSGNIIYSTQYIGYLESYYLGALWLEYVINNGKYTPASFLEMLSNNNKGEFFRLWQ